MTEHYLDRLARAINENWDQLALTDFYLTEDGSAQDTSRGNHYTYGEMYEEILHVCDIFQSLGLQKGDHIAICGANSARWAIAYLAIAAYQGVAVTILHSQSPEDIAHQIDFSDAKALFMDTNLWEKLKDISIAQVEHVISFENWQILLGEKPIIENRKSLIVNREACFDHGDIGDLAMIGFTSGSTGNPKGVMLSYRNISNNVHIHIDNFMNDGLIKAISFMPMAHAGVFVCDIVYPLCRGKSIYILHVLSNKDLSTCYYLIQPERISMVPMMLSGLLRGKIEINNYDTLQNQLKSVFCGQNQCVCLAGSKIPIEIEELLIRSKINYVIAYGATECAPLISVSTINGNKIGAVGRIVKGMICRIAPNGEILVKGENVMLGYYKTPEATARKIDQDGWLHTGDKGHLDEDGYLYVEGRLEQDMIVLPNGENIHPEDIERKINALPEVSESIVLARDGKLVAIVVPSKIENRESKIESDALRRHVLRTVNPQLPLYSQLYDIEITNTPFQKTEKQTLKRYLYK